MFSYGRGDVVGLIGYPGKSKKGELSIFPTKIVLLSACLHMLPKVDGSLKEQVQDYIHSKPSSLNLCWPRSTAPSRNRSSQHTGLNPNVYVCECECECVSGCVQVCVRERE